MMQKNKLCFTLKTVLLKHQKCIILHYSSKCMTSDKKSPNGNVKIYST